MTMPSPLLCPGFSAEGTRDKGFTGPSRSHANLSEHSVFFALLQSTVPEI